jgi:hypothetical protein
MSGDGGALRRRWSGGEASPCWGALDGGHSFGSRRLEEAWPRGPVALLFAAAASPVTEEAREGRRATGDPLAAGYSLRPGQPAA